MSLMNRQKSTLRHNISFFKYYYSTSFAIGQGFIEKNIRKITIFFGKLRFFRIFYSFVLIHLPKREIFYLFLAIIRSIHLTSSTMGITKNPIPIAIKYSVHSTEVNPNAPAKKGTSHTSVVKRRAAPAESQSTLFCFFTEKSEFLCERILKLWKISAMDIVKNAIVIPCSLLRASQVPPDIK